MNTIVFVSIGILLIWFIFRIIFNMEYNKPINAGEIWVLRDVRHPAKFKIEYVDEDYVVFINLKNHNDKYRYLRSYFLIQFKKDIC